MGKAGVSGSANPNFFSEENILYQDNVKKRLYLYSTNNFTLCRGYIFYL